MVDRKEQKKLVKEAKSFRKNMKNMTWDAYFKAFRQLAKVRKLDIIDDLNAMEQAIKDGDDKKYKEHFMRVEAEMLPTLSAMSRTMTPKQAVMKLLGIKKKKKEKE